MYVRDTIAAVSTPPGNGGIGIIRISGDLAANVGNILFKPVSCGGLVSHRFSFGSICDPVNGRPVDEAMAVYMRAPKSYTREDIVELHCHGGWLVIEKVLSLVLSCGVRLADPGEFTRRAFLNGRIDLIQAEAVMDVIASKTESALKLAEMLREGVLSKHIEDIRISLLRALALVEAYIDFPDDDIGETDVESIGSSIAEARGIINTLLLTFDDGRIIRDGISVLIIGKPNVGKSSLLNMLLNENRAIVTPIPGTTRDTIEETINIDGLAVRLLDTAGIRRTSDFIELEGINRALEKIPQADLVLAVFDASQVFSPEDQLIIDTIIGSRSIAVLNKTDLEQKMILPEPHCFVDVVEITALLGGGIDSLKRSVSRHFLRFGDADPREFVSLSRSRHKDALVSAENILQKISDGRFDQNLELLALDLRCALQAVGALTGQTATDEVLDLIFSSFCIGK